MARRAKSGVEGVGDLLLNITVTVAVGDEMVLLDRRGEAERAVRRRVTELEEAKEVVELRERCGAAAASQGKLESDALGVSS